MSSKAPSLIIVSNRLPVSIQAKDDSFDIQPSSGGLASALNGVKEKMDFTWLGWPGTSFLPHQKSDVESKLEEMDLVPIFINREQEEHFYHSFCNSILWPLFHYFTDQMNHSLQSWQFYKEVNEIFTDKIVEIAPQKAIVWVHDFHLMLVPEILRKKRPDLKICFFLHIPFPSSEIYRIFPKREELLKGVLGADYIGFHTSDYARHFRLACQRVLGLDANKDGVILHSRKIGVGVHPIGMNIASFDRILQSDKYSETILEIKQRYKSHQVILGVERLDYIKGISFKLKAFEQLLEKNPELVGHVILLQIIVPCRHDSTEYQKHRSHIEKEIGRINGKYSKPGFTPIQYLYRNIPLEELIALYCLADVCVISSLRDGMNLVAQEFVYSANAVSSSGALVLSEFAGASHHLPHALIINPIDIEGSADTFKTALTLTDDEKSERLKKMAASVKALNSPLWAAHFLEKLNQIKHNPLESFVQLSDPVIKTLYEQAEKALKRILFLDYDGSLREITTYPSSAKPNEEITHLLKELANLPNTEVHLVSGRDSHTLKSWFGSLPLHLSAEHGFLKKAALEERWEKLGTLDTSWIPQVKDILLKIVQEVPGSFVEEKNASLAWHYRASDIDYGTWRANELFLSLKQDLSDLPCEIIPGKKVIEVRSIGISKAKYIQQALQGAPSDAFILCVGDDVTDQQMYQALPINAFSIHVGSFNAKTSIYLESPKEVRTLLKQLHQKVHSCFFKGALD